MEHGCGTWQWPRYIEIMMYLSSTITLIISHLQGAALRSEQIHCHALSPCIVLMKVHGFLPLRIALTPQIPPVYKCLQILILFSLNGKKNTHAGIQYTSGTPNIMSQEIVTYKTTGPILMNVKPGPGVYTELQSSALKRKPRSTSPLCALRTAAALQMQGPAETSICVNARA